MMKQLITGALAIAFGSALTVVAVAQSTEAPSTQPAAAAADAAKPSSPEAQRQLDQMKQAYAKLKSLELAGTIMGNFDVAGQQQKQNTTFSASYQAPNQFRHEMKDEMLVGSTGEKVYLFAKGENAYLSADHQGGRSAELPQPYGQVLQSQNPSLVMAISDVLFDSVRNGATVELLEDVTVDDKPYRALQVTRAEGGPMKLLVDPQTHLVRRVNIDMRKDLETGGVPDVKAAEITIDYTTSAPDAPVAAEQFAWTPPQGAKDASQLQQGGEASALEGKPAPDFSLPNLQDEKVALADLKGKVVVLDFWATWCGPCIQSMPHLEQLHQDLKDQGVQVLAVNLREDKDKVAGFMNSRNFTLPVVLDKEGSVGDSYQVTGIPQTVVIGKDGTVKKVMVGSGPGTAEQLRKEVEAAMK